MKIMTQETAKKLLQKTKVIRDNFYQEPIEPEHEDEQKITIEFLSEVINYLENDTDKLQEQINTAKNALTEIAEIINDNIHECNYSCDNFCELDGSLNRYSVENVKSVTNSALAEIVWVTSDD